MECPRSLISVLMQVSRDYADTLVEYCKLALRAELTDEEVSRMAAIYTKAESDQLLDFFISELDYVLGQEIGLMNTESVEDYKNQQAWLREHLEEMSFDQEYRIKVQQLLQQHGFYDGPIDGVLGDRSVSAVERFQESQRLDVNGVPNQATFTALQSGGSHAE